jgi:AraC-like DNA-binding protein/quercetin dioxygenase-like cupin family protein
MAGISLDEREISSRVVRLRRWRFDDGERFVGGRSAHPGIVISWCHRGRAEYWIGERRIVVLPGQAMVVPADVEHATLPEPGTEAGSLLLAPDSLAAAAEVVGARLGDARLVLGDAAQPSALGTLGILLEREGFFERPGQAITVDALTDAIVVEVLRAGEPARARASSVPPGRDPRIKRAIDFVETRYADPLTVDDMARAAHMSRFHFTRAFRAETGKSPYRYLMDVRLAHAAVLLRERRSVTEAALSVGWNDLGRFGRMFREAHGVAPSAYLRAAPTRVVA